MEKLRRLRAGVTTLCIVPIMIISLIAATGAVHAVPAAPPNSSGGNAPRSSSANISYAGITTFSADASESGQSYGSTSGGQNAVLVSGGEVLLADATVTKSGDESGDSADFYGTNAAILAYNGAVLNIRDSHISTDGSHANAVFAYGNGTINISDAEIITSSNNSGGVMVTGGGTLTATDLRVQTAGNSAAAIRSDRGGGTLTATGGEYITTGVGSPVIYSTADITVKDAKLTATASEGAVVEGANSITLDNVNLTDTNNTLNGNSETYKNIFLYQSMSGDADEGVASFTAKNSQITTNQGDTIFVTNTTAEITLENNTITNGSGDFLRVQAGKWGNSDANGGKVTIDMSEQKASGDVVVDKISTVNMTMTNGSVLKGAINPSGEGVVNLNLSANAVLVLSGDTYIDTLENAVADNANIYLNGHTLYVAGVETAANTGEYIETEDVVVEEVTTDTAQVEDNNTHIAIWIIIGLVVVVLAICAVVVILMIKRRRGEKMISKSRDDDTESMARNDDVKKFSIPTDDASITSREDD